MLSKIIGLALISFYLLSCANRQAPVEVQNLNVEAASVHDSNQMIAKTSAKIIATEEKKTDNICSIKVVFRNSYCGGAKPSEEMLDGYKTEYPLRNSTILLKDTNGKGKSVKVSTDQKGFIHEDLMPSTYNYFMTENYDQTMGSNFSSSCETWLSRCFGQLIIIEGQTDGYKILFDFGCNPCEPPRP